MSAASSRSLENARLTKFDLLKSIFRYFIVGLAALTLGVAVYTKNETASLVLLSVGSVIVAFSPLLGLLTEYRKRLKH